MQAIAPAQDLLKRLEAFSRQVRLDVLHMTHKAASGHPGGSFSMAELVTTLYETRLRVDPANPKMEDRDRFILSKGHCAPALYSVLGRKGFFPVDEFDGLRRVNNLLQGHTDIKVPGVDMSAGSLGMGLGYGNGIALALRLRGNARTRVWVMLGDGECQEGNVWESAMTTPHRKLDNVTAIVDYNKIQIDGLCADVKRLEPLADRWRSFGWDVKEIDGHDVAQIIEAYDWADAHVGTGEPACIVAHTVKGKGVSFMEGRPEYHGRALTRDEMQRALDELGASA